MSVGVDGGDGHENKVLPTARRLNMNVPTDSANGHGRNGRSGARWIGGLFLAAFFLYGGGSSLVEVQLQTDGVPDPALLRLGALGMLANSVVVMFIGGLMSGAVNHLAPRSATIYLAARAFEAAMLAVGAVFILLIPSTLGQPASLPVSLFGAGNAIAFAVAMFGLGMGSLPLFWTLRRHRLVPGWLAAWGFIGYAVFAAGAAVELVGTPAILLAAAPGGIFEVVFAVWLIVRGWSEPRAA
jgi:hypothetical protein